MTSLPSYLAGFPDLPLDLTKPWALLADIHGNIDALTEVVAWLDARDIAQAVVLGDIVGYGAAPAEVIRLVRDRSWSAIGGNHEEMLAGREPAGRREMIKERARRAIEWTREHLDSDLAAWVSSLPLAAHLGSETLAVHGSLVDPRYCYAYLYDLSLDLNVRRLRELDVPPGTLVLHGHTHWPRVYRVDAEAWLEVSLGTDPIVLDRSAEHFVNPGSVGYPRDGDPRASFMILHPGARRAELVRLAYDVEAAATRIERAGYAPEIAERLRQAR